MILFDSSAILNLLHEGRGRALIGGCTLDLAGYELGSAIRRQVYVERALSVAEGVSALRVLEEMTASMARARASSLPAILESACREGLTFYDASYLTAAVEGGHRLVTDDERLLKVAARRLKASRSSELP
ncbi:MAG: type II toxin-antitoxin system VapC family toxin [Nitrososphaerales archaeon]|jgi:predicted nucleic acid-binding protein